jgi:hypothetical protein
MFAAVLLAVPMMAVPGWAQDGVITGRISDPSDAVLPGVTIRLTSPAVMGERTQISDERGNYRFTLLPPGSYSLKFELPSFRTLVREGIQMSAGFTATINATLEVASVGDTVTVVGESPAVDVERATVSNNFNNDLVKVLPISNNYYEVLSITPGLQLSNPDVGGSLAHAQQGVRAGGINGQFNIVVDGINVTQETDAMSMYYDNNSMQEYQIVEVNKSAETNTAGVAVNMIVKSGSNQFHGSANLDWIDPKFQGNNLTDKYRALGITYNKWDRFRDWYFDAGGPIKKDKFWWYAAGKYLDFGQYVLGFYEGSDSILNCDRHGKCTSLPGKGPNVPAILEPIDRNATMKYSYQINANHSLSYTGMLFDKFDAQRGCANRFCTNNDAAILYKPIWAQKLQLNSILGTRMTLENRLAVHRDGPRHEYSKSKEMTRFDLDTQERRGAYCCTGVHENDNDLRQTWDTILGITAAGLGGTHNIRTGYTWEREIGRPIFDDRYYGIKTEWRGGFKTPAFIWTYDTPFIKDDRLKTQAMFFNDTFKATRKLTLNLGFRFDHRLPYRPSQEKLGIGRYQEKFTVPAIKYPALNNPVARLSLVYDVFGNGRTAFKFGYAGYSFNPQVRLTEDINPMEVYSRRYTWDGYLPPGFPAVPYVPDPTKLVSATGGKLAQYDPNLKLGRTDEYMVDIEHQIIRDMSLRFNVVRKRTANILQVWNSATPYEAYNIPVTLTDAGRDNKVGTSDDQQLTVFGLDRNYVGLSVPVRRNQPDRVDNFLMYSFGAVKRFSSKWQLNSGLDVMQYKFGDDIQNPNQAINNGDRYWTWQFKALGSYQLPKGFNFSSTLRSLKGAPRNRTINTPSLTQGVVSVRAERLGAYFYPTYHLLDFQLQKTFVVSERWGSLTTQFTLANVLNSNAVLAASNQTGVSYDLVTRIVDPRVFRLGLSYKF